ncbi:Pyruvate/Phosphoenolpyruvate kinase-like domain-containing protein [Aspergillus parasiticus]|uniref:Pyruvate/Phosphoenolpyruvate kinase-like domain-containing protein n=2 Tax=Aspergillus subgen. Circumdati TaxID=2720871 RepID=A0A5N6DRG4_ASPPA|nr:Pyruvate/Phosphoenolpyruvate kinase-like domain-containing protein [Aspergillus parasiticus]KAE8324809.1 Pyruvate/Phosphoenolpyruvate kinase-like domain-containing protein [Aspergillus sergii]
MALNVALRTSLARQSTAYGFWLTVPSAPVARTILRAATASPVEAFSWVLVDAEHGLITDRDYYDLTTAIAAEGASPIIRVPWQEEWMIKRALDSGAHGILTPMCHSVEDARRIVRYCKYPPVGCRGYGPLYAPHAFPGVQAGAQYDDNADQNLLVMVQIESRSGLDSVEEIAKVEGLDVLLIGPFDLAKQIGVVRGGDEHTAAIDRILKAAKAAGKKAAIFCTSGEQAREYAEQGFDMVSVITDQGAMGNAMVQSLSAAQGRDADNKPRDGY